MERNGVTVVACPHCEGGGEIRLVVNTLVCWGCGVVLVGWKWLEGGEIRKEWVDERLLEAVGEQGVEQALELVNASFWACPSCYEEIPTTVPEN